MTFTSSVRKYLKQADYLGDEDAPAVEGLRAAAKELDKAVTPALLGQYRLLYKGLEAKSQKSPADDDDDELLSPGGN